LIRGQHGGGAGTQHENYDPDQPPVQLFDLQNDTRESNNLAQQHPSIVNELTKVLLQTLARPSSRLAVQDEGKSIGFNNPR
jgi:hypothetical protein